MVFCPAYKWAIWVSEAVVRVHVVSIEEYILDAEEGYNQLLQYNYKYIYKHL